MPDPAQTETLFTAYARSYAETFDEAISEVTGTGEDYSSLAYEQEIMDLARVLTANRLQTWFREEREELGGLSGGEILDGLETPDELMEALRQAAVILPDELPDSFKIVLGRHWEQLAPRLEQAALGISWLPEEDVGAASEADLLFACDAIVLLGEWRQTGFPEQFMDKFLAHERPHELIADAGKRYFAALDEGAVEPLLTRLRAQVDRGELNSATDYLLIFLTESGKLYPSDEIYGLLRDYFRRAEQKAIPAICVGDYGDGRGVTLLRGWVNNHAGELDRQVYYEILSSIARLGGQHSDLPDPFHDFDGHGRRAGGDG